MEDHSVRFELLSAHERETLSSLGAELQPVAMIFHRRLNKSDMCRVGQIIMDLHFRTNDENNLVLFALGDWMNQANEWFGGDAGIRMALGMNPTLFNTCFISYSSKDEDFAKQLHAKLRAARITVWYAPKDVKGGEKLHEQIDIAIREHDRLLLILSEDSLRSEWVMTEIRKARKAEIKESRRKLFPVRLCTMDSLREWECFDADTGRDLAVEIREYFIPDFSGWKENDLFEISFARLLDDLKTRQG